MNDKIITYADLDALLNLRAAIYAAQDDTRHMFEETPERAVINRLIAVARADQPPLPEGWVVYTDRVGVQRTLWHEGGRLYDGRGGDAYKLQAAAKDLRDRLTPLRPTVTEADVEKAASEIERLAVDLDYTDLTRAAFKAAGIEATS